METCVKIQNFVKLYKYKNSNSTSKPGFKDKSFLTTWRSRPLTMKFMKHCHYKVYCTFDTKYLKLSAAVAHGYNFINFPFLCIGHWMKLMEWNPTRSSLVYCECLKYFSLPVSKPSAIGNQSVSTGRVWISQICW